MSEPGHALPLVGVLGGMSWRSTEIYYREMNRLIERRLGGHHSMRLLIDSMQFAEIAGASNKAEFRAVRQTLERSARRLSEAGAARLLLACNTVHRFADSVEQAAGVPLIHIADAVGAQVDKAGHQCVGLLGTAGTMDGSFYSKRLLSRYGVETRVPALAARREIHRMLVEELTLGSLDIAPRLAPHLAALAEEGCTAVILGCTELGLAYSGMDAEARIAAPLPLFDSAVIHSHSAAEWALSALACGHPGLG